VTGMRFIEHNNAIYPQLQVGKMVTMAKVDQKSVYWLDVPNDNDYFIFDYDNREISFGDPLLMQFGNGVVTGKSVYVFLTLIGSYFLS
jgi:hypothetical protein